MDGSSNDGAAHIKQERATSCDEKSGQKFKRPPRTFTLLPPPPEMATSLMGKVAAKHDFQSTDKRIDDPAIGEVQSYEHDKNDALTNGVTATTIPALPTPLPPTSTSVAYQRVNRKLHDRGDGDPDTVATNTITSSGNHHATATTKSYANDSYSNSHQALRYQSYSNNAQIAHPYQPSSWYEQARNSQRKQQLAKKIICAVIAISISILVYKGLQKSISHDFAATKRHFKNYHHHDHRNQHFHPMLGIVESPLGFAKEVSSTKTKSSYRQLEQQIEEANSVHDLFSTFPVVTLNNNRFLPCVGFGVSSRSVEHKQIPSIVSTLLNYASSETEGGGGIAMIDTVMDESSNSDSNQDTQRYDEEEAALESSLANTVVTIVGRSIMYFGKERIKSHVIYSTASAISTDDPYDYDNRLEVHLLVGLSDPDLGIDNTIVTLRHFVAELDGIVPPLPTDLQIDPAEWQTPSSPITADHRADVRLHVLISLKGCQDRQRNRTPCSSDEDTNKELLDKFIESYALLENLYTANIIHGIGLDGIHPNDIAFLLKNSKIKPQLFRGDVSQALGCFSSCHRGIHQANAEENIDTIMKEHGITFLASNVAGHILERSTMAPNAYALLQNLGGVMYRAHLESEQNDSQGIRRHHDGDEQYYTVLRLVLSYLVRQGICVLPHAYKAEHLADDAPESVGGLAKFLSNRRVAEIGAALSALVSGNDLHEDHGLGIEDENKVAVAFHNQMAEEVLMTRDGNTEELPTHQELGWTVKSGDSVLVIANTGDSFVAYGYDGRNRGSYTVNAEGGGAVDFTILP